MTELLDHAAFTAAVVSKNNDDQATQDAILDLLAFSDANADWVEAGKNNGSFHHVIDAGGRVKLFYVFSSGDLEINPNWGNPFVETLKIIREREKFVNDMICRE